MKVMPRDPELTHKNAKIFLANGNRPPIIPGNKTRQGYVRKHILKLAGYFFVPTDTHKKP